MNKYDDTDYQIEREESIEYEESKDTNVGSIEEAIKILKNAIKCNEKQFEELGTHILLQEDEEEAIKIVLKNLEALCDIQRSVDKQLERQKQINEELKHKLLDTIKGTKIIKEETPEYIEENYIPKQKIKDRFEEIQKLYEENIKQVDFKEVEKIDIKIFESIKLEAEKELLIKLLQEEE